MTCRVKTIEKPVTCPTAYRLALSRGRSVIVRSRSSAQSGIKYRDDVMTAGSCLKSETTEIDRAITVDKAGLGPWQPKGWGGKVQVGESPAHVLDIDEIQTAVLRAEEVGNLEPTHRNTSRHWCPAVFVKSSLNISLLQPTLIRRLFCWAEPALRPHAHRVNVENLWKTKTMM